MPASLFVRTVFFAVIALLAGVTGAAEKAPAKIEAAIRAQLTAAMKDTQVVKVSVSPVAGLFEVELDSGETALVTADGLYLISGDLYQTMPGKGLVNLSELGKGESRRAALERVDKSQMVTFPARGAQKSVIYVFTDVDCGYCRKLHQEVPQLNAAGITVHYLAFPRNGMDSQTARKMDAVWCAPDRGKAMTESKRGSTLPAAPAMCKSPVAEQYRLGNGLGVRGTPAIFDLKGAQIGGYIPAAKMIELLLAP